MFNKFLSLLILIGLIATFNLSISAQTQSFELKNSQQSPILSKKEFYNSADRANELLNKDSFAKVKKDNITAKAMKDADKAQQKKKFTGIGTTALIGIGVAVAAVIIIVLATRGDDRRGPINCGGIIGPCP